MAVLVLGDIRRGGLLALAAAVLFGASTPAAKAIIGNVYPVMLAGLLYLGSGVGLSAFRLVTPHTRDGLKRRDLGWLTAAVMFGGVVGPALLMYGLTRTTGSSASLLLTLEGVFTALLAWIVFREPFNRRIGLGMASIFIGAVLLAIHGPSGRSGVLGAVAIAGACLAWAVDNNCTQKIAHVHAPTLTSVKGLVAGVSNVALALALGDSLRSTSVTNSAHSGSACGLFGIWRQLGPVRAGAARDRRRASRRLLLHSAVHWRHGRTGRSPRAMEQLADCCWRADGLGRLAAPDRTSRAFPFAFGVGVS